MEYYEAPSIQETNHKIVFPRIKWLTKEKFIEQINKGVAIHPFIDNRGNSQLSNRYYVGKTIQHNLDEGVRYDNYYYQNYEDQVPGERNLSLEIIGTVFKNPESLDWQLDVAHGSQSVEVKKQFLVLCIEDSESYEWIKTNKSNIPRYALRGCIDRLTNEFFYIGRTSFESNIPKYYQSTWKQYEEPSKIPVLFGKVHVGHSVMYIPFKGFELAYDVYDILCLKPTPSRLINQCRWELRKLLGHSNEKIERINQSGIFYLPDVLIDFIKYPSYLKVGEYMLKDEKIVRKDGKFEMCIERNGKLVIKSVILNKDKLDKDELIDLENTQIIRKICENVHTVWLSRFQVALYRLNTKVRVIHNFFDKSPEYVLAIDDAEIPNFVVKNFNEL